MHESSGGFILATSDVLLSHRVSFCFCGLFDGELCGQIESLVRQVTAAKIQLQTRCDLDIMLNTYMI